MKQQQQQQNEMKFKFKKGKEKEEIQPMINSVGDTANKGTNYTHTTESCS